MTEERAVRCVQWFFDFISPFAYLQWQAVKGFGGVHVDYRPVLLGGAR